MFILFSVIVVFITIKGNFLDTLDILGAYVAVI